jgi:hypothetical protein
MISEDGLEEFYKWWESYSYLPIEHAQDVFEEVIMLMKRIKELEKELYMVHDLELGMEWQKGGENPISHRHNGHCYTCKVILNQSRVSSKDLPQDIAKIVNENFSKLL